MRIGLRLIHNDKDILINEYYKDVIGVNALSTKIENGLKKLGQPWKECIPYYKNCYLGFINEDSFKHFLFHLCKLNDSDLSFLKSCDIYVEKNEVECYSNGLSKSRGTFFQDEIVNTQNIDITSIDKEFKNINQPTILPEEIRETKDRYYKNLKIY